MAGLCAHADPAEAVGDTLVGGPVSPAGGMGWDLWGAGWGVLHALHLSFLIRRGGWLDALAVPLDGEKEPNCSRKQAATLPASTSQHSRGSAAFCPKVTLTLHTRKPGLRKRK